MNFDEMRLEALLQEAPPELTGALKEHLIEYFNNKCATKPDRKSLVSQAIEKAYLKWREIDAKDRPREIDDFYDFGLRQLLPLLPPKKPLEDLRKFAQDTMKTDIVFPFVHATVGQLNYRRTAERTWTKKSQIRVRVVETLEKFIYALRLKKIDTDNNLSTPLEKGKKAKIDKAVDSSRRIMQSMFRKSAHDLDVRDLIARDVLSAVKDLGHGRPAKNSIEFCRLIQTRLVALVDGRIEHLAKYDFLNRHTSKVLQDMKRRLAEAEHLDASNRFTAECAQATELSYQEYVLAEVWHLVNSIRAVFPHVLEILRHVNPLHTSRVEDRTSAEVDVARMCLNNEHDAQDLVIRYATLIREELGVERPKEIDSLELRALVRGHLFALIDGHVEQLKAQNKPTQFLIKEWQDTRTEFADVILSTLERAREERGWATESSPQESVIRAVSHLIAALKSQFPNLLETLREAAQLSASASEEDDEDE